MSQYCYSPLSPGANNIRLIRLMPHTNESTERNKLECELFEYSLQDLGKRTHLYEALSYTWGSLDKPCSISINQKNLAISENLYTALTHLQDCSLQRVLWIDAICINQENRDERGQQVQLMAMIYSKAHSVLVWLGETANDTEGALEDIQRAANEQYTKRSVDERNEKAITNLLQRQWFQRIWVLQEIAAARHIVIMCGSTEIDGYAFCSGLDSIRISQNSSYAAFPELHSLPSVTDLIKQAVLRPKYRENSLERYSLEIRSLAELVDMFHNRQASQIHDKVYALLGMSSDNLTKAGLQPDYNISWEELFQQLIKFILGKDISVETSSQKAVIKGKGCILGQVSSVRRDDRQNVRFTSRTAAASFRGKIIEWTLQASAKPIQERDIICLLYGVSKPTIIRLCNDHFVIIMIAVNPLNGIRNFIRNFGGPENPQSARHLLRDFRLVWNWEQTLSQNQKEYTQALEYTKAKSGYDLSEAIRVWNDIMILDDLGEKREADKRFLGARIDYEEAFGLQIVPKANGEYGRSLLSFAAGEGHEDTVKLLLQTNQVEVDSKDTFYGRTPLSWASENGHEAVVKLLLETGQVEVDWKDEDGQTPLWRAAENRHEAVVKLLLETGQVEVDWKDEDGWTPLWRAARNGHEEVVKLLLETGQVEVDSKDKDGRTPLWWAAENRHEAVVKLLLETDQVEVNSKDTFYGRTPLWRAAQNGHEAAVKLLLETSQVEVDSKDKYGWTPLLRAAENGHEAVVKLLLETGQVEVDLKDKYGWTPLWWAAENGHEAVVKLLLRTGQVEVDSKDTFYGRTPLWRAAQNGHEVVVKLLLEAGQVEVDLKDKFSWTPLWRAAENGHEAMVKLLLETGQVEVDWKDEYGQTPLWRAAENGHEAVVKLLLETGQVEVDWKDKYSQMPLSRAARNRHEAAVKLLQEHVH